MRDSMRPPVALGEAPGKLILFGEHSVAYGQPAVGVRLSRGVRVALRAGSGHVVAQLSAGIEGHKPVVSPESLVRAALGPDADGLDTAIEINLPPSAGLGTSAALAIALLRAKATLDDVPLSGETLLERAIAVENVAHGRSSGLDPSICLNSGVVEFARIEGPNGPEIRVRGVAPAASFHLVIGVIGSHGGTGARVAEVAAQHRAMPVLIDAVMAVLGEAAQAGGAALISGDLPRAGAAMNVAHGALTALGLVSESVEMAARAARAAGALGAKMTGAGGSGGAFYALASDVSSAMTIQAAMEAMGARAWIETAS